MRIVERTKKFIRHRIENAEWTIRMLKFCYKNRELWGNSRQEKIKDTVFIANAIHNMNEYLYQDLLFAKGMENARHCNILVLSMEKDKGINAISHSFGAKVKYILNFSLIGFVRSLKDFARLIRKGLSGTDLLEIECRGILIGPAVYDTILVCCGEYTVDKVKGIKQFGILWRFIYATYILDRLFALYNPISCIVMEETYESDIYKRLAVKYDVKVIWVNKMIKEYVDMNGKSALFFQEALEREILECYAKIENADYEKETEEMLKAYYEKGNEKAVQGRTLTGLAVRGKVFVDRETIERELKIDMNKKNAFIFVHCLTDGPHACPDMCYKDYFEWLDRTLTVASENDNVNWIVKFHPDRVTRNAGERNGEIRIRQKYSEADNIFFFPDNFSIASVASVADVIITVSGEVGEEMSCLGIPIIAASKPYYKTMNYVRAFSEQEQYEEAIKEIEQIEKLSKEDVLQAKKFFYAHTVASNTIEGEAIGDLIIECNNDRLRENAKHRMININFWKKLVENDIISQSKLSALYKNGEKLANMDLIRKY